MERVVCPNDQVDAGIGPYFLSLSAAALWPRLCEWLLEADRGQLFLADGARNLPEWVSARFGLRHATASQLVRVARRIGGPRFCVPGLRPGSCESGSGGCDLEAGHTGHRRGGDRRMSGFVECGPGSGERGERTRRRRLDVVDSWRERWLSIQYTLDGIRAQIDLRIAWDGVALVESEIRARAVGTGSTPKPASFVRIRSGWPTAWSNCVATTGDENGPGTDPDRGPRRSGSSRPRIPTTSGVAEIQGWSGHRQ